LFGPYVKCFTGNSPKTKGNLCGDDRFLSPGIVENMSFSG